MLSSPLCWTEETREAAVKIACANGHPVTVSAGPAYPDFFGVTWEVPSASWAWSMIFSGV